MRLRAAVLMGLMVLNSGAQPAARYVAFVTCPIVRDTKTIPCWLAEYQGETYFLGVQGGVVNDFYPPQLNHEVLVEGVVAEGERICGGLPLRQVKTSVLLEINRACNTILPAEDAFEAPARPPAGNASWVKAAGPGEAELYFDFDNDFLSLHTSGAIQRAADFFRESKASRIEVTAYRGASKLTSGQVMAEREGVAAARAAKVAEILVGLGVPPEAVMKQVVERAAEARGYGDAQSRRVVVRVVR